MIDQIKTYFNDLGWAANIMAFLPIFGGLAWVYKKKEQILGLFSKRAHMSIADYLRLRLTSYEFDPKRVKIVVIDDTLDDFPINYLKNSFGEVVTYSKFSLSETSRLMGYDLVFLDMMGVVTEDQKYGGLQLIKKIKQLPDPPTVVAVSGARFDPTASDYFKAADDVLKKPLSEFQCGEVVLELLKEKMSPYKAADTIDGELMAKSRDEKEKGKLLELLVKFLDSKIEPDEFRAELVSKFRHVDTSLIVSKTKRIKDAYGR